MRRATLAASCFAVAALVLNVSAPTVALASIAEGIGASFSSLQWIVGTYALCLAVFQLGAGRLADRIGRRRVFLLALAAFVAASSICALAPNPLVLIVARGLQGASAAALTASSLAVLANEFSGHDRSRAIGAWGATLAFSFAAGPVVGGWLVGLFDWRAIFVVGIPPSLISFGLVAGLVRESRDPARRPIDLAGLLTAALFLLLLMFAILRGNALGWESAPVMGALGAATLLLVVFVLVERASSAPMLDLSLFRNPTFNGASLLVLLMSVANFGAIVYLAYFLLVAREFSPIETGLALAPAAVTTATVSLISGRMLAHVSLSWRFAVGQALLAAGLLQLSGIGPSTPWLLLVPGLVLSGAGVGFTNPLSAQAHLAVLPPEHAGLASGINNTARQLGVALGTAIMGVLLEARVSAELSDSEALARVPAALRPEVLERLGGPDPVSGLALAPTAAREGLRGAYEAAYASGLGVVLVAGTAIAGLGIVVGFLMVRERDFHPGSGRGAMPRPFPVERGAGLRRARRRRRS